MEGHEPENSKYHRNDDYTGRMPSPPRIAIPVPSIAPNFARLLVSNADRIPKQLSFLCLYDWTDLTVAQSYHGDWKYEFRRRAQKILPFIYLGPISTARDKEFLMTDHITMILSIRHLSRSAANTPKTPAGTLKVAAELGIETHTLNLADNQQLIAAFPLITHTINEHLLRLQHSGVSTISSKPSAKVLVTCESGNERSAAAVTAYVMQLFELDMKDAIQVVHAQRLCIHVDEEMKHILVAYDDILRAKRDVAIATINNPNMRNTNKSFPTLYTAVSSSKNALKRNVNDDDEEDMDDDDELRFGNRTFMPFKDSAA